jgi:hypothetical protein
MPVDAKFGFGLVRTLISCYERLSIVGSAVLTMVF